LFALEDRLFYNDPVTLKDSLHPPVIKVFDPAAQPKFRRKVPRKGPVKDALHPSFDKQMRPREFHAVLYQICRF
jgi:hypothetical protein